MSVRIYHCLLRNSPEEGGLWSSQFFYKGPVQNSTKVLTLKSEVSHADGGTDEQTDERD